MAALGEDVFKRASASTPAVVVASPTFEAVAREWLVDYPARHSIRPNTLQNYQSFIDRHLIPFFGAMPVDAISVDRVEDFIAAKRASGGSSRFEGKPLADSSLATGLHTLGLILKRAVRRKLVPANVAREAEWRGVQAIDRVDPFSTAELGKIQAAAVQIAARDARRVYLPAMIAVWMRTGLRAGEVSGLQWQDVDLAAGTVRIERTYSRRRLGPTKTGRTRIVSMCHPIGEIVADWRPRSDEAVIALRRLPVRGLEPSAFVFSDTGGATPLAVHANALWRRVLRAAGVRHTFASTMLSRNAPLLYVQQQGGWKSATVLLRVYSRWLSTEDMQPDATSNNRARLSSGKG
jgi:integrase